MKATRPRLRSHGEKSALHLQAASIKLHRVSALLHFSFRLPAPGRGLISTSSLSLQLPVQRLRLRHLLFQLLLNCIKLLPPLALRPRQLRLQGKQGVVAASKLAFQVSAFILHRLQLRFHCFSAASFRLHVSFQINGFVSEG